MTRSEHYRLSCGERIFEEFVETDLVVAVFIDRLHNARHLSFPRTLLCSALLGRFDPARVKGVSIMDIEFPIPTKVVYYLLRSSSSSSSVIEPDLSSSKLS